MTPARLGVLSLHLEKKEIHVFRRSRLQTTTAATRLDSDDKAFILPDLVFASSEAKAREVGLERIRGYCPEADGWSGHGVSALRRCNLLEETLGLAPKGLQDDDDSNATAVM